MGVKTKLEQRQVASPEQAEIVFSEHHKDAVPLVLIPPDRSCCSCSLVVPSGAHNVLHKCGEDVLGGDVLADPGCMCKPSCYRVAYCVAKQACTYNAPVKSCPTQDDVKVDCDITLVFQIVKPKKFVYTLGATGFDDFLAAAIEEGIRHLIRTCTHDQIYELRGANDARVSGMMDELNRKFKEFGVKFSKAAITMVSFKKELQDTLENTTKFKSQISEAKRKRENQLKKIQFESDNKLKQMNKKQERFLAELKADRERDKTARKQKIVEAKSAADIRITKAKQKAEIGETRAASKKAVATLDGKKTMQKIIQTAEEEYNTAIIACDQENKANIFEAQQKAVAAKSLAAAVIAEAEAEGKASSSLKAKREHDLELAKIEILQYLAKHSKMIISGKSGDDLINAMLPLDILSEIKLKST